MCTLTLFPHPGGSYRLAFNRDESRARPAALPPVGKRCGPRGAVMPVDPVGAGTWIAANDAGLVAALLNLYDLPASSLPAPRGRGTRGEIIPRLMIHRTLEEGVDEARSLVASRYLPFRLCLSDGLRVLEIRSDGRELRALAPAALTSPLMMTSSGLGDDLVETPRRELFQELLCRTGDSRQLQDAYHRHSWPDRPQISVCMRRPEACTVSHTIVELDRARRKGLMVYHPGPPDEEQPRSLRRFGLVS